MLVKTKELKNDCPVRLDKLQREAIEALRESSEKMKERIAAATLRLCNTQTNAG